MRSQQRFISDDLDFIRHHEARAERVPREYLGTQQQYKRMPMLPQDVERLCRLAAIALKYQPKRLRNRKCA